MPIFTEGSIIRRGQTLEEFETPFGDYISQKFQQAIDSNPMSLIGDNAQLNQANTGAQPISDPFTGFQGDFTQPEPPPRLAAEDIAARAKEAGVKVEVPDEGLSEEALQILIKRRQREAVQQDAIARSPTGSRSLLGFGVQLGASILDPLNIGLAFVPVVGPARYSTMLAKAATPMGRAGVRAGVGAAEGAVGVAAFEPFSYSMHQALQDDYSAMDSLMNIAVGSVMGGGLHVSAGAAKDAIGKWWMPSIPPAALDGDVPIAPKVNTPETARTEAPQANDLTAPNGGPLAATIKAEELPAVRFDPNSAASIAERVTPETREATLRTAVGQAMDGRDVDIEPLMRADIASEYKPDVWFHGTSSKEFDQFGTDVVYMTNDKVQASGYAEGVHLGGTGETKGRVLNVEVRAGEVKNIDHLIDEAVMNGEDIDDAVKHAIMEARADGYRYVDFTHPDAAAGGSGIHQARVSLYPKEDLRIQTDASLSARLSQPPHADMAASVSRLSAPESVRVASVEASRAADERLAVAPKSEALADAEAALSTAMDDLTQRSLASSRLPDINRELAVYDDAIKASEELGLAARAAAICDLRG